MKKVILYIAILLLTLSCEGYLELVPPDGLVKDEFWKSKEDMESVLLGAYQQFAAMDEVLFYLGEVRAGMLWEDVQTPFYLQEIFDGIILPDNQLCDWRNFYLAINYCNAVIQNAPVVKEIDLTLSDYQMDIFISEATFLRSLAYFYLVRTFRDVPMILEAVESDAVDIYLPASPATDVLSQIKSDLLGVRLRATTDFGSNELNKGRATKAAITALLADICLWNFEYEECIGYVEELEAMGFPVIPNSQWFNIFYPGNSLESIFEFQFNSAYGENNTMYAITNQSARRFRVSPKAYNLFFSSVFNFEETRGFGTISANDDRVWKYVGREADGRTQRSGADQTNCNYIIYRMSDLALMKAEALSQLSRFDEALAIVNHIRINRRVLQVSPVYTEEAFEDVILNERALELAFEGKRWFDLLRMGRRNDYKRKEDLIDILVENVASTRKPVMEAKLTDPSGWYLPVYDKELERNKYLEQNPYYDDSY
jgi:hypothetical protein